MTDVRNIRIDEFDYPLPDGRIARYPLAGRDTCRLLVAGPSGKVSHSVFSSLPLYIKPDTLIVANETKVIRARLDFVKETGAKIEIFLLEPMNPADYAANFASLAGCSWACMVGNRKRWKEGVLSKRLDIGGSHVVLNATLGRELDGNGFEVSFFWEGDKPFSFAEIVETAGNIPIPPYLKRNSEATDTEDYQTVYSHTEGSVAAPTAGLHFTPGLIQEIKSMGCGFSTVTLHVGAGTFQPVKSDEIGEHPMHSEWFSITRHTLSQLITALEEGHDILAVGTTSVRTLESLPYVGAMILRGLERPFRVTQWMPYEEIYGEFDTLRSLKTLLGYMKEKGLESFETHTSIMIAPGFRWRVVNRLITNFHQPKSTLLLLVSSFLGDNPDGTRRWRSLYEEALNIVEYRFLSYGDACLFSRGPQPVILPKAKSMTLRAATILAEVAPEKLDELYFSGGQCDDSLYYMRGLRKVLESAKEKSDVPVSVFIGEGAAPLRFLTAFAASLPHSHVRITCAESLQRRPILPLIETLGRMGADVDFLDESEEWAITLRGRRLRGGSVEVDSSFTSQYVSALMLASPLWEEPLMLSDDSRGNMVSRPYVRMTEHMLAEGKDCMVESDWSAAAFFYEYCLVSGRDVEISGLVPPARSLQGDSAACDVFAMAGVNTSFHRNGGASLRFDAEAFSLAQLKGEFEFDFNDYPDMVPSVAVALCWKRLPFRFRGVGHLRFKECDRLAALYTILVRLGYGVGVEGDTLVFDGEFRPMQEFPVEVDPYGDHRMAMAFYPLELMGMCRISDKGVVSKSFPDFYQQF